jgi:hypothetical protein
VGEFHEVRYRDTAMLWDNVESPLNGRPLVVVIRVRVEEEYLIARQLAVMPHGEQHSLAGFLKLNVEIPVGVECFDGA